MSSLVLLTSCWWQFTIVPMKVALIKTMTVKVTDISTTLEKTLMATSNKMLISTVTNNSLFLIQSISLHLCLQLTANPGFKLFIMNCSKNYQLHLENNFLIILSTGQLLTSREDPLLTQCMFEKRSTSKMKFK